MCTARTISRRGNLIRDLTVLSRDFAVKTKIINLVITIQKRNMSPTLKFTHYLLPQLKYLLLVSEKMTIPFTDHYLKQILKSYQ